MTQYKYYFKKPKAEIAKDILTWIAISGTVYVAASSPYFVRSVFRQFKNRNKHKKYKTQSLHNAFYRLRKDDCIIIHRDGNNVSVELTEKGRKKAGRFQINHLKIKKPKKWDKKWRIIIFDISHTHKLKRDTLRGFLRRLDFRLLQKSAWIYPYDCKDEIDLLRDFFGLSSRELRFIVSADIGDDRYFRKQFKL